jgi:hypothetical protein
MADDFELHVPSSNLLAGSLSLDFDGCLPASRNSGRDRKLGLGLVSLSSSPQSLSKLTPCSDQQTSSQDRGSKGSSPRLYIFAVQEDGGNILSNSLQSIAGAAEGLLRPCQSRSSVLLNGDAGNATTASSSWWVATWSLNAWASTITLLTNPTGTVACARTRGSHAEQKGQSPCS